MARAGLNAERVTAAAAVIADADGLSALTLARLAVELGVRVPSLYKHISSLDDLHRRLAVSAYTELSAAICSATVGLSGRDALRACAIEYRRYASRHPGCYLAAQRADPPGIANEPATRLGTALVELIFGVSRGYHLDGEALIHATRIVRSALHGFVSLEQLGGFGLPAGIDDTFETMIDLLDGGLSALGRHGTGPGMRGLPMLPTRNDRRSGMSGSSYVGAIQSAPI